MRGKLQIILRDIAPFVALVLALLLTVWTRHAAAAQYPGSSAISYYQGQLWNVNDPRSLSLRSPGP